MLLHFPIGFVVLLVLANVFRNQLQPQDFDKVNRFLLLLTAFTTVLTALMGFFLAQEDGYTSGVMSIHKWIGVAVSYLMYVLILFYQNRKVYQATLYSSFIGIVIAGHFGAGLTHGINFLTEPIIAQDEVEFNVEEPVITSVIMPVLESKCVSCHGAEKKKGELDFSSLTKIHEGGKNGPVWIAGDSDSSQLIQRAMLPLEHKKHMPPKGKPQLTNLELALMQAWIEGGADETMTLAKLDAKDTLAILANQVINKKAKPTEPTYNFDFADPELVASLNSPYRTVTPLAPGSPAVDVKIFGRNTFQEEFLTELAAIREQIVSLDLSYLPLGDEVFQILADFKNLEELTLNFTDISGEGIESLNQLENLRSLSLSGTKITQASLDALNGESLQEIFIWNTAIAASDLKQANDVTIVTGFQADESEMLPLTEPILLNGKKIITADEPVVLTHKINGAIIRYTDDGSNPDSASRVFSDPLYFDNDVTIKAIAYKEGWIPSDTVTLKLIQRGVPPVDVELLYPAEGVYKGRGKLTLIDDEVGNTRDFPYFSWLGFYHTPFATVADMGEDAPIINTVAISYGVDQRSRAAVPQRMEIWGGDSKEDLKLLSSKYLRYQKEIHRDRTSHIEEFEVPNVSYRYYKIVADPMKTLPEWHRHKGKGGAVFVDQIFFYGDKKPSTPKLAAAL